MTEINPFIESDYLGQARETITWQFKGKEVVDKYLQLLTSGAIEAQTTLKDLMQLRSIDTATGAQLDILGAIVGQDRVLAAIDFITYFGFENDPFADGFGELGEEVGGNFYSLGDPVAGNVALNDDTYRLFIKAKILKNKTASTTEDMIAFMDFLFGEGTVNIQEIGDAEVNIYFLRDLTTFEQGLLYYFGTTSGYKQRMFPKTIGVKLNIIPNINTLSLDFANQKYASWVND